MTAATDVGSMLGSRIGSYGGGALGGAIGELFGPEAVPLGAYLGSRAGAYAGGLAGAWAASKVEEANQKADDKSDTDQKKVCTSCLKAPNRRHDPCKTKGNDPTKNKNTMIDPDSSQDVSNDIKSIQNGEVPQQNGSYTVNGRTYGVHDGTLYPQSGPGLVDASRGTHQVLKQLNSNGYDAAMNFADKNPSISEQDKQKALELWNKCNKNKTPMA